MKFIRVKDYDEVSELGFKIIEKTLKRKKDAVINFTTGDSPRGLVNRLADSINDGLDVSEATFMNLDEYVCPRATSLTVYNFMHNHLYDKIKTQPKNVFLLNGEAEDLDAELADYKAKLDKYPADVQIVGLGVNGHIGANEPGTPFDKELFVADSHEATIRRHMEQYDYTYEEVPKQMITLGMKDVMKAKTVLLLVSGEVKAEAMRNLIYEAIDVEYPASILRTHPNFICIYDDAAASKL